MMNITFLMPRPHYSSLCFAFVLIELLVVIVIIAGIAALLMGIAGYALTKADTSKAKADMERIGHALEGYRIEYGSYPINNQPQTSKPLCAALWVLPQSKGHKAFLVMKGWNDPLESYTILDPWGNEYRYLHRVDSPHANHNDWKLGYDLWSMGPDGVDNSDDDINNWSKPH